MSDLSLQRHDLVDNDVGVLDLLQLGGCKDGQLPRRLVFDGMQGQLAGLVKHEGKKTKNKNRTSVAAKRSKEATFSLGRGLHLLLPVLDLVVVLCDGGVDLLDAEPDA